MNLIPLVSQEEVVFDIQMAYCLTLTTEIQVFKYILGDIMSIRSVTQKSRSMYLDLKFSLEVSISHCKDVCIS